MQSRLEKAKGFIKTTRDTSLWAGQWAVRNIAGSMIGLCPLCNNLQPRGHEDRVGRNQNSLSHYARGNDNPPVNGNISEPALALPWFETKELLKCRETDPRTGRPIRDCRYCRLLCDVFDAFFIDQWMSWIRDTEDGMHLEVGVSIREGFPLVVHCSGSFTYDRDLMNPRVDLELFCDKPEHLAIPGAPTMGLTLERVMDTRDPSCMQFARDCIQQCTTQHPACWKSTFDFVPTRLLYIRPDSDDVVLCEGLPISTQWAALSHCWGGSEPLKLKTANRSQLKDNIKLSDLPPTFKNAIEICRALSITHLWIDSLCIIQDDDEDWTKEAAQMGRVYSDAFLVIVGASSQKPEIPYLAPRDEEWETKTFEFHTASGATVPIKARKRHLLAPPLEQGQFDPPFTGSWATLKRVGPLYKRAWCFQESYLACRALHFSPASLIFECKTCRRSQDSPYDVTVLPEAFGSVPDCTKWQLLVKQYTARYISFPSDKLPAISGIAAMMPQAKESRYLAGLWSETLLMDLLWQVMASSSRSDTSMAYPPEKQMAPSWSWASIDKGVLWNTIRRFEPLVTVLEASCDNDTIFPYGSVRGGYVKLRGRVKPCFITHNSQKGQHHAYYTKPDGTRSREQWFMGDGMIVPTASERPDEGPGPIARRHVIGTPCGARTDFDDARAAFLCFGFTGRLHYNYVGLIISASAKHPDCFERIGNITSIPSDWYETAEDAVVVLR